MVYTSISVKENRITGVSWCLRWQSCPATPAALWVVGVIENIGSKQQLEYVVIIAPATRNGTWQPKGAIEL